MGPLVGVVVATVVGVVDTCEEGGLNKGVGEDVDEDTPTGDVGTVNEVVKPED